MGARSCAELDVPKVTDGCRLCENAPNAARIGWHSEGWSWGVSLSLHVLAYNMKRMIQIFGAGPLLEAIRA